MICAASRLPSDTWVRNRTTKTKVQGTGLTLLARRESRVPCNSRHRNAHCRSSCCARTLRHAVPYEPTHDSAWSSTSPYPNSSRLRRPRAASYLTSGSCHTAPAVLSDSERKEREEVYRKSPDGRALLWPSGDGHLPPDIHPRSTRDQHRRMAATGRMAAMGRHRRCVPRHRYVRRGAAVAASLAAEPGLWSSRRCLDSPEPVQTASRRRPDSVQTASRQCPDSVQTVAHGSTLHSKVS